MAHLLFRLVISVLTWTARYVRGGLVAGIVSGAVLAAESAVCADDHWAFRALAPIAPPAAAECGNIVNPIDAFVAAKLVQRGLHMSPAAEPAALLRRAYFDLVGLPPSPDEVEAIEADLSDAAWLKIVDRLLASPHFGERWGRHWLDQAGYVDVLGGDNDAATIKFGENKWLYRDYVVASFNADKPFDRFLTEQLAGDELVDWRTASHFTPETRECLIATGFLRVSADDTNENELNTLGIRYDVLHRTTEIVATNLLGLTIGCAKCHDHKFEPLTQRDYYSFESLLQPAFNPDHWLQPQHRQLAELPPAVLAEAQRANAELDKQIAGLEGEIKAIKQSCEARWRAARLATLPEPIRADTEAALAAEVEKRTEVERYLADKFATLLKVSPEEVAAGLSDDEKSKIADLQRQIGDRNSQKRAWQHWQVVYDAAPPTPTHLLKRGNWLSPGDEVLPGFPKVLCTDGSADARSSDAVGATSGRRLTLARWLTQPDTPAASLVARVWVNRVWQHLFGRGIVETSDNFGMTGSPPTHPELLDWLAVQFIADGWRLKPLLRRIMSSQVYRQTSAEKQLEAHPIDPDNRLLWRQRLKRLDSEAIRDAVLEASGRLDRSLGGPPIPVEPRPGGSFVVKQDESRPADRLRRTIYLLMRRNYHPTVLAVFDQPVLTTNCTRRDTSAVVLQSLTMLNDDFVLEESSALASHVMRRSGTSLADKVDTAFRLVLSRRPAKDELSWCLDALSRDMAVAQSLMPDAPSEQVAQQALARFCQTLLNSSEFLYVP